MRLLHEIAVFQTVKSNVIFSLFETVRLSVSISLRNLYNSLNSIKENRIILSVNFQSHVCTRRGPQNRWANTELLVAVAIFLMSGKSEKKKKKKKEKKKKNSETTSKPDRNIVYWDVNPQQKHYLCYYSCICSQIAIVLNRIAFALYS